MIPRWLGNNSRWTICDRPGEVRLSIADSLIALAKQSR